MKHGMDGRYYQASVLVGAVFGGKRETCPASAEVFEWPFIGPCFPGQASTGLNVSVGKGLPRSFGWLFFF